MHEGGREYMGDRGSTGERYKGSTRGIEGVQEGVREVSLIVIVLVLMVVPPSAMTLAWQYCI